MSEGGPIHISYNLNRLGQTGDEVVFAASESERDALARFAGVLAVAKFDARIGLKKLSPTRFGLSFELAAEVVQACVVTLEPLTAVIARRFDRELHFAPPSRRGEEKALTVNLEDDEAPEEIESLHYDLAGPLVEEFVLAIDPYPRGPGALFAPPGDGSDKPENPFAALRTLKSDPESTK